MKCKEDVKYCKVGNYQKYCIDLLPLRKHVNKQKMLIAGTNSRTRSRHIHGMDAYDKSRQLSAMNKIQLGNKKVKCDYVLVNDTKILLSKYIKQLKVKHTQFILDAKINRKLYVQGNAYEIISAIA